MTWRWIVDPSDAAVPPAATGARNMAIDAALLAGVADGAPPAVRLYRWTPACLSFGRNQAARGEYDGVRAATLGIDIVRRPTGGLAVLHDAELTYALVAPARLLGGPRSAYRRIHAALSAGLARLGLATDLAGVEARLPAPDAQAPPCFAAPAGGEVMAAGRKLVGSAQRTERRTVLQHGSILLEGSQARVSRLRARPDAQPDADGSVGIAELLGRVPEPAELAASIRAGLQTSLGIAFADTGLSAGELTLAGRLEVLYRDDAWTWRR